VSDATKYEVTKDQLKNITERVSKTFRLFSEAFHIAKNAYMDSECDQREAYRNSLACIQSAASYTNYLNAEITNEVIQFFGEAIQASDITRPTWLPSHKICVHELAADQFSRLAVGLSTAFSGDSSGSPVFFEPYYYEALFDKTSDFDDVDELLLLILDAFEELHPEASLSELVGMTTREGIAATGLLSSASGDEAKTPANKPYPSPKTYEKDKFIYENITKMNCNQLKLEVEKRKTSDGWKPITTAIGFRKSALRYSTFHKLPTRNFQGEQDGKTTETD